MRKVQYAMLGLAFAVAGSAQAAGFGARIGTTGVGGDFAWSLAPTVAARLGYSGGKVDHDVNTDLTTYHGKLNLSNFNALLDFSPLGPFRITGGFIFNDNKFDVHTDQVQGGSISGTVKPGNSSAPYLGVGYGNVAGAGVNFYADLGVMFQGSPKATLNANCGTLSASQCSSLQSTAASQQAQLEDKLKNAKYYPVLNIGVTIGF